MEANGERTDLERRFGEIVTRYSAAMRRLAGVYAFEARDREDLYQDVFLAVWKALPRFRGDSSERTWIYSIAHNVALTWKARGHRRGVGETRIEEIGDRAAITESETRRLALTQLIAKLPPLDRQLVTLWLEGLTMAEMSEITGVRSGTVAVRLTRAKQTLAELFEPREARHV